LTILGQAVAFGIWMLFQLFMVEADGRSDITVITVMMVILYVVYYMVPHLLVKREDGYKWSLLLKLIGPIAACVINAAKDGKNTGT
jgi:hypothetical protein